MADRNSAADRMRQYKGLHIRTMCKPFIYDKGRNSDLPEEKRQLTRISLSDIIVLQAALN